MTTVFANRYVSGGFMAPDHALLALGLLFGSIAGLAQLALWAETTTEARRNAHEVFRIMEGRSKIDALSEEGLRLSEVVGRVEFENVHFRYATRPDVQVFRGFSLTVEPNTTVALVGSSGSGKSTAIARAYVNIFKAMLMYLNYYYSYAYILY